MSITIIRDASALDKLSADLVSHIRDTDERIAQYLLSEVVHIEEHRNPTRLNKFFSAIKGSGQRVNAMHNFVQYFGNLKLNDGKNGGLSANNAIRTARDGTKSIATITGGKPHPLGKKDADGTFWNVFYAVRNVRKTVIKKVRENGKEVEKKFTIADGKYFSDELIAFAQSKPWYQFLPERPPVAFNADEKVKNLVKSLWKVVLDDGAVLSEKMLSSLTELSFDLGIIKEGSEVIPADVQLKDVPEKYRPMLHLVASNENAPAPAAKPSTPAKAKKEDDKGVTAA